MLYHVRKKNIKEHYSFWWTGLVRGIKVVNWSRAYV